MTDAQNIDEALSRITTGYAAVQTSMEADLVSHCLAAGSLKRRRSPPDLDLARTEMEADIREEIAIGTGEAIKAEINRLADAVAATQDREP